MAVAHIREIFKLLHFTTILAKIDQPIALIRETFVCRTFMPADWDEFLDILIAFYQHFIRHYKHGVHTPREQALGSLQSLMNKSGGLIPAAKKSVKGSDTGLPGTLDRIRDALIEEYTKRYVSATVYLNVDPLNFEFKTRLCAQYLALYAHALPDETFVSPAELAANLEALITFHLRWIQALRTIIT